MDFIVFHLPEWLVDAVGVSTSSQQPPPSPRLSSCEIAGKCSQVCSELVTKEALRWQITKMALFPFLNIRSLPFANQAFVD